MFDKVLNTSLYLYTRIVVNALEICLETLRYKRSPAIKSEDLHSVNVPLVALFMFKFLNLQIFFCLSSHHPIF